MKGSNEQKTQNEIQRKIAETKVQNISTPLKTKPKKTGKTKVIKRRKWMEESLKKN